MLKTETKMITLGRKACITYFSSHVETKLKRGSQVWWCVSVLLAQERLGQDDWEIMVTGGYTVSSVPALGYMRQALKTQTGC